MPFPLSFPQILGFIHLALLFWAAHQVVITWFDGFARRCCATILLIWANLVATALLVSCFNKLNSPAVFGLTSLALAALLWLTATHVRLDASEPRTAQPSRGRWENPMRAVLWIGLALCAWASLYILATHSPTNWDSSAYRFPRAMWYLQQGNLLHFAKPFMDPRALYYPFNGTILYIFMALYQFGEAGFTAVTFVAWCACGLGVYAASRQLGASFTGGLFASFLGLLTPTVLCQATSTNDEILAASAVLLAFPFGVDWASSPKRRYAFLAGIGLGLGVGTKLHWAFYYPYLLLAGAVVAVWVARHLEVVKPQMKVRIAGLVLAAIPVAVFGADFVAANWLSARVFTISKFNDSVMNKPFNLKLAQEKLYAGTGQLLLAPIPDILRHGSEKDVAKFYEEFNKSADTMLFSGMTEIRKVSPEGFQFKGPLADGAASYIMNEYTVFTGLLPWLVGAAVLLAGFRTGANKPALWAVGSLLGWHLCYVLYTKYIPGASAYYTYPSIIACAGLGPIWDWSVSGPGARRRILAVVFAITAFTDAVIARNIFEYNNMRNVVFGWTKAPSSKGNPVDPAMEEAIKLSSRIHIPHLAWSQMMWHMMRHNPVAAYSTGPEHVDPPSNEMNLIGVLPEPTGGRVAVVLPRAATTSAVYLGQAFGQRYYGTGAVAVGLHPEQPKMAIVSVGLPAVPAGKVLQVGSPWAGVKTSDGLQFRASLASSTTKRVFSGPWRSTGETFSSLETKEADVIDEIWIDLRHPSKPKEYVRTFISVTALAAPLPGRAEVLSDDPNGPAPETVQSAPLVSAAVAPKGPQMPVFDAGRGKALPVKLINATQQGVGTSFEKVDYFIRWIPKSSNYEFENSGAPRKAEFALKIARAARQRTLRLKINGVLVAAEGKVLKTLWVDGMDEVRFPVNLGKGLNKFELFTPEELDSINTNNDKACCLLIGEPVVIIR